MTLELIKTENFACDATFPAICDSVFDLPHNDSGMYVFGRNKQNKNQFLEIQFCTQNRPNLNVPHQNRLNLNFRSLLLNMTPTIY